MVTKFELTPAGEELWKQITGWEGGELKGFKKVNLIFGFNGTGKTTLSRWLYQWKRGEGEQFLIPIGEDGKPLDPEEVEVEVFNSDFLRENLYFHRGRIYIGELASQERLIQELMFLAMEVGEPKEMEGGEECDLEIEQQFYDKWEILWKRLKRYLSSRREGGKNSDLLELMIREVKALKRWVISVYSDTSNQWKLECRREIDRLYKIFQQVQLFDPTSSSGNHFSPDLPQLKKLIEEAFSTAGINRLTFQSEGSFLTVEGLEKGYFELSEGEKSLIGILTFCHYLAQKYSDRSQRERVLLWIDDPVTSLDEERAGVVRAILKEQLFKGQELKYRQLFLTTHYWNFFWELKRWEVGRKAYFHLYRGRLEELSRNPKQEQKKFLSPYWYLWEEVLSFCKNPSPTDFAIYWKIRKLIELYQRWRFRDDEDNDFIKKLGPYTQRLHEGVHGENLERDLPLENPEVSRNIILRFLALIKKYDPDYFERGLKKEFEQFADCFNEIPTEEKE